MYKKNTLNNGLRVVLVPMESTQAVTVLVLVATGSKYENKQNNGISHFLEHMFFKGTKKRPSTLAIAEELDRVGGEYNAFTGKEFTGYYAKVDYKHLDLALDIVSDIFLNSKLEPVEIDKEKKVIIEEIKMYQDTPMQHVVKLWEDLLYQDQPAGWHIAGTPETVSRVKQDDLFNYLSKHYLAANTLVCLAGKIDSQKVLPKIEEYFKAIRPGSPPSKEPVKEKQLKAGVLCQYKKTDQTHLCLGVRAYGLFHPDRYTLSILSVLLGGFMSSRLWIAVREQKALAYYVRTSVQEYTDSGYLVTQAGVDHQKVDEAIKTILDEYEKIKADGIGEQELLKTKDHIKGSLILELEGSDEMASWLAGQEILEKEILTPEQVFAMIDKVTIEDIRRVAKDIFKKEKLNLALIGPFRNKKIFEKILIHG